MKTLTLLAALLLTIGVSAKSIETLTPAEREKLAKIADVRPAPRQLAWQQLEIEGFVHFTVNTYTGKEWGSGKEDPKIFNPTHLDCRQWVRALKSAGAKLILLTAKHHDGFCLWPTKTTRHSVASSPWKNGKGDVVREFVDACRAEGVKVGLYLSPWDRNAECYGSPAYNDFFVAQLNELFENYGPIEAMWFDGACGEGPNGKKQVYDWPRFYATIRKHNPNCVISVSGPDVRWVGNEAGYARESEWSVVPAVKMDNDAVRKQFESFHYEGDDLEELAKRLATLPIHDRRDQDLGSLESVLAADAWAWYPAETNFSIRPGWFYHASQDGQVKDLNALLDRYYSSVGRNTVMLINVPPAPDGRFHERDVASLEAFGKAIRATFAKNLLGNVRPGQTEAKLDKPITFDVLMAQEDIAQGQRVERFRFEAQSPDWEGWKTIASATTIGYKRLLRLKEPVTATAVRLVIEETRATPHILSIGAYKSKTE